MGAVVVLTFCRRPQRLFADARRPELGLDGLKRLLSVCRVETVGGLGLTVPSCEVTISLSEITVSSSELTERASESEIGAVERSADLSSEAAETLRCARSGGPGPSAEAAVTRDRRDRERHAVRSRSGAESAGWREVAEWCDATEGTGHE